MKLFKSLAMLVLPLAILIPGVSNAQMLFPALEINVISGSDTGLTLTASTLTIDATVTGIIDELNNFTPIAEETFTLTATGAHSVFTPPGSPVEFIDGLFDGTFSISGGLLSGSFTGLTLSGLSSQPTLSGDLVFLAGSLKGAADAGRLEMATAGSNALGKLGAVVPVPAAVWLFGSGLLGLVGIARRKA